MVGLEIYAHAVEVQAQALRDMALRAEQILVEDRTSFAIQHKPEVQRIQVLADRVADLKAALEQYRVLKENHDVLVNARAGDIKDLQAQIANAKVATKAALAEQDRLEKALFQAQRAVGQAMAENLRLENQLRSRERAE